MPQYNESDGESYLYVAPVVSEQTTVARDRFRLLEPALLRANFINLRLGFASAARDTEGQPMWVQDTFRIAEQRFEILTEGLKAAESARWMTLLGWWALNSAKTKILGPDISNQIRRPDLEAKLTLDNMLYHPLLIVLRGVLGPEPKPEHVDEILNNSHMRSILANTVGPLLGVRGRDGGLALAQEFAGFLRADLLAIRLIETEKESQ